MKCPECGSLIYTVADKREDDEVNVTRRRKWCGNVECGARWGTVERIDKEAPVTFMKRTQPVVRKSPNRQGRKTQPTVPIEHNRQCETTQQIVLTQQTVSSPSYSDPISSSPLISKISDPDLTKQTKLQVDRARAKRLIAAFCEEWGKTHASAKYRVTPKDAGQAGELFKGCPDLTDDDWRAACARYVRSTQSFFATSSHPLALLAGNLNQFTADPKPTHNGLGHSPVIAGKDYSAGMELWKRKAAT